MTTRESLIDAAKELLWERGYDAMSPADVLRVSGVGQGSLYHHFTGKADLAATAVQEVATEMELETEAILQTDKPAVERLRDYLMKSRAALLGCRLGRLAYDPQIVQLDPLRAPVASYFASVERMLTTVLLEAQQEGSIEPDLHAADLATSLVAVVQGGYVLARANQDPARLDRATRGALSLLDGVSRR
jgi:AcrR family transcriptional regulator